MVASMIGDSALYAVKQLLEFEANPDGDSQVNSTQNSMIAIIADFVKLSLGL